MKAPRGFERVAAIIAIGAAGMIVATSAARAQNPEADIQLGKTEYMGQCASCHGKDAKGDGPVAEVLSKKPTDLTQLTREYQGRFPREHLVEVIDGRKMINPHGDRDMPVWGYRYQAEAMKVAQGVPHDVDAGELVLGRITALVQYLESIQAK